MNIKNLLEEEFDEEKDIKDLKTIFNEMKVINEQYLDFQFDQIELKWFLGENDDLRDLLLLMNGEEPPNIEKILGLNIFIFC